MEPMKVTGPMKSAGAPLLFLIAVFGAAVTPLLVREGDAAASWSNGFPGWPNRYEGRPLTELALSAREAAFGRDFPGKIGRFSDGRREIILRWIGAPTRRLHSAADCFRGSGYAVKPLSMRVDTAGAAMGCFRATRGGEEKTVCEMISGADGRSWSDASSWYWDAMLGKSQGPWWSVVVAEEAAD